MNTGLEMVVDEVRSIRRKLWSEANHDYDTFLARIDSNPRLQKWMMENKRACARAKIREAESELAEWSKR